VGASLPRHLLERPERQAALAARDLSVLQNVTEEGRAAIRDALLRAQREGKTPKQVAREIRDLVGLNVRQEAAVARYRAKLETEGRKADQVDRMVKRYADKQRRLRSETIAITELARAANEGQREQWARLVEAGKLDPDEWLMEWVTARDERTCPHCGPMHGVTARIGGTFTTTLGIVAGPILHPRCRCILRLRLKGLAGGANITSARDRILAGR
jgi:hypothetical protein